MIVTLFCTGRGTHRPVPVHVYDGEIPVPGTWRFSLPSTVSELVCWRFHPADRDKRVPLGGCGYSPRPSDAAMRALIGAAAASPGLGDISYSGL